MDGLTPLHVAARKGYLEIYKFIAEREEDINPKDSWGRTPLSFADENGHYEIVQLICDIFLERCKLV